MASSTQVALAPNGTTGIRRRQFWGSGGLIAQGASGLVNVPGLKEAVLFAKEGAKALKRVYANQPDVLQAPKWNDEQARKQIGGLEGILARIDTPLVTRPDSCSSASPSIGQGELDEVELLRRDMEAHKMELEKALSGKYSSKLARQNDIAQFLAQKNEQISERVSNFCVDGGIKANQAVLMLSESERQIQILSVLLAGQSERI
ncbi:hypothetical protein FRC11_004334, partial [Ceratobasidium sp. 423]